MSNFRFEKEASGIVLTLGSARTRVIVVADGIIHVVQTLAEKFGEKPSMMILPQSPGDAKWELVEENDSLSLRTSKIHLKINRETGAFTWMDAQGNLLVREAASGGRHLQSIPVEKRVFDTRIKIKAEATIDGMKQRVENARVVVDRTAYSTKLDLVFSDGEGIYGLGQHEEGILNYRGHCQFLYQQNMKKAMPIIVSTRGYGILWDTTSLSAFHDDVYGSYFWTEVDDEMDFYFLAGPEFDQIIAGVRRLTGKSTLFPRWAFGYVQSKER